MPANTFVATLEAVTQAGLVPVAGRRARGRLRARPGGAATPPSPTRTRAGRARPPLRAALRTCRRSRRSPSGRADAIGGRRAGARRQARRLPRRNGRRGRLQLLPRQEPRRDGRRRRARHRRPVLAERVRALREHGQREVRPRVGGLDTARLDTIQAVVLLHKLPHLDGWNAQRRRDRGRVHGGARGRRRPAPARRAGRLETRLAPLRRAHRGAERRSPASARAGDRHRAGTTPSRRTCRRRTPARLRRGRVPGHRGAGPRVPVAADLPRDDRGAGRSGRRRRARLLRPWL